MKCVGDKQFFVGSVNQNGDPVLSYIELNTEKNAPQPVVQTCFEDLAYTSQNVEYESTFYISEITDWNLDIVAYSKMVDVGVLRKQVDNVSRYF